MFHILLHVLKSSNRKIKTNVSNIFIIEVFPQFSFPIYES